MSELCPRCGAELPSVRDAYCPDCREPLDEEALEATLRTAVEPPPAAEAGTRGTQASDGSNPQQQLQTFRAKMRRAGWGYACAGIGICAWRALAPSGLFIIDVPVCAFGGLLFCAGLAFRFLRNDANAILGFCSLLLASVVALAWAGLGIEYPGGTPGSRVTGRVVAFLLGAAVMGEVLYMLWKYRHLAQRAAAVNEDRRTRAEPAAAPDRPRD
jgi:hypothetical protein